MVSTFNFNISTVAYFTCDGEVFKLKCHRVLSLQGDFWLFVRLSYQRGTVVLEGNVPTPYCQWDSRIRAFRASGYYYRDIVSYRERSGIRFEDNILSPPLALPIGGEEFHWKTL